MHLGKLRELPLPPLLVEMIDNGRWVHPGDEVMLAKIPFIHDQLDFIGSKDRMLLVSDPVMDPDEAEDEYYSEYMGSQSSVRDLPWIDVEQTLFIICNRSPGADVGIALDYRSGKDSPRVIGEDWHSGGNCIYREISPSFDAFVELLGL